MLDEGPATAPGPARNPDSDAAGGVALGDALQFLEGLLGGAESGPIDGAQGTGPGFLAAWEAGEKQLHSVTFDNEFPLPSLGSDGDNKVKLALAFDIQVSPSFAILPRSGTLGLQVGSFAMEIKADRTAGLSLSKLGLDTKSVLAAMSADVTGVTLEVAKKGKVGASLTLPKTGDPEFSLWFDVIGLLFPALAKLNQELKEERGLELVTTSKFTSALLLTAAGPKPTSQAFDLGLALKVFDRDGEAKGSAGADFNLTSTFTDGTQDDPFSSTEASAKAFLEIKVGAGSVRIELPLGDAESVGRYLETVAAEDRIAAASIETALAAVFRERSTYIEQGQSAAVRLVHRKLEAVYTHACDAIEADHPGVKLMRRADFEAYYVAGGALKGDTTTNYEFGDYWLPHGVSAIASSADARAVHEDIIFDGAFAIGGDYIGKLEGEVTRIAITAHGDHWTGVWDDGHFRADARSNALTVSWSEGARQGTCDLQIQDHGARLVGRRDGETWVIERR
jgi:hypothetical protein